MELITLPEWFDLNRVPGKKCNKKLQRWVREDRIIPSPEKIGREYLVVPTAKLITHKKSKVAIHILEQAKSDALKLMYLDRESALSHLMTTIG